MDANRLRTNQDQAESEAKQTHATAVKVTGTLDAAKLAFAEALEKKDQAEGFAATKWDEAAAAAERAQEAAEAAAVASQEATDAGSVATNAVNRRQTCANRVDAAEFQLKGMESQRVDIYAHDHKEQQRSAQPQPPQPLAHQATEEVSDSQSDWKVDDDQKWLPLGFWGKFKR